MNKIVTFDLEDWYQLLHRRVTGEVVAARKVLIQQVDCLLEILDRHNTKATFFVLGMSAEAFPPLIRRLSDAGHEIAAHGYAHLTVYRTTRQQFREDTRRAKQMLEDMSGKAIVGYRATAFSITRDSLWALEELAEMDFAWDSSIFPIRHRRYGIPNFPLTPARYNLPNGRSIIEIPLATIKIGRISMPIAGGGYFRLLPYPLLRAAVQHIESEGRPFMTYFHPYEFDSSRLEVFKFSRARTWRDRLFALRVDWHQNLGRNTMVGKLNSILSDFRFSTAQEYLDGARLAENSDLLPPARSRF